jgi:pyruvate/2-oxoglutarate dehydrogenase complex dihydrolipoamide acyltransferase (E2) component
MTVDTLAAEPRTDVADTPDDLAGTSPAAESAPTSADIASPDDATSAPAPEPKPKKAPAKKAPAKKAAAKKTKTLELTLTVTGTADGEWHAELKQGSTYLARNLAVAAAAVSRAAKELHEDLSTPIDEVIEAAREQQAARVAALEAELEAARKALADLAD